MPDLIHTGKAFLSYLIEIVPSQTLDFLVQFNFTEMFPLIVHPDLPEGQISSSHFKHTYTAIYSSQISLEPKETQTWIKGKQILL